MTNNSSPLFNPLNLRSLSLSNRIVVEPMCQYSSMDGNANEWHRIHLGSMALSGAGLLIVEATACEARGRITPYCLGLYSEENERTLSEILHSVRSVSDIPLGIQIGHAGRKASIARPWQGRGPVPLDQGGWATIGPSPISFAEDWPVPREISREDMVVVRDAHVKSAERADRLGFDLIEIHSAHGYLLSSFLSPLSNQRRDDFGGTLENRMRFPLEVISSVRDVWPRQKPMSVKFNGTDWAEGGFSEEDVVAFATALGSIGVDMVVVSGGGISSTAKVPVGPAYQLPFAELVKKNVDIVTGSVGVIHDPHQAEDILSNGQADLICMARAFLFNPRWMQHAALALNETIPYPVQYERASPPSWKPAEISGPWPRLR